jgi:copper chaperone CopZ
MNKSRNLTYIGTGLITAIAASLCCITPLLALLAGTTRLVAGFGWLESFRPYLIMLTVLTLGFSWYHQLKADQSMTCHCESQKTSFWQSKRFLSLVNLMAILFLTFPSYSNWLAQDDPSKSAATRPGSEQVAYVNIKGMTCSGCELHVRQQVTKLPGVSEVKVSYQKGQAVVTYDSQKTSLPQIHKAIASTGYQVVDTPKQ